MVDAVRSKIEVPVGNPSTYSTPKNSSNFISRVWNTLPDSAKALITLAAQITAAVALSFASITLFFGVDTLLNIVATIVAAGIALTAGVGTAFFLDIIMPEKV